MNINNVISAIDWISLGSSLGALSAALIALFTLLELFRQRKSSYKPDLCTLKTYYYIKNEGMSRLNIATSWGSSRDGKQEVFSRPVLNLANIGFGAAKDVKAKWSYNQSRMVSEINELAQKTHQTYYLKEADSFVSLLSSGESIYSVNSKMDEFSFEYVLPLNQGAEARKLDLPPAYVFLVSVFLSLSVKQGKSIGDLKIPELKLELSYSDIGGGKHNTTHIYKCEIMSGVLPSPENDRAPEFEIQFFENSYRDRTPHH